MPKEIYIPCLLQLFRRYGYDGATLSRISEATGLGKASLYHHFPGGKEEMVATVLQSVEQWRLENIVPALEGEGDAITRLRRMCDRFSELYEQGEQPCLSAILLMGSARDVFHDQIQAVFSAWLTAISDLLVAEGVEETLARQKAEDVAIAIQGSLILAQALDQPAIFQRVLQELPERLISEGPRSL
ncbi:TetR/AcrR family transcriptional regulator [Roseofilum casamattae]|uniref:TetR/AcrR family transcriptional regulator n=1 Tax=Roseofilum casamattae BLCC-M143 TaxID=3022442 RepID=A0ABT7BTV8_9CYAN|nr:TetR/AcrR family transcriptional regulator [Roseofilum casamattae]MDJ1182622.1 TetR/AcrR family transcriptional regulator [Roseofilum casamattae BLCC-M143]